MMQCDSFILSKEKSISKWSLKAGKVNAGEKYT